ncbi:type VII secretion protein EssB [Clostridium felsineum]|uniref:Type VII secretion system protein EssB n=1 Tax=Clostridium felsineum TaxID=36839 RepID=A0A1S8LPV0_9CLOT|nr:type VII secretion protein EssB [Clostridium felsineum]URZ08865.1 Type VII secretion system protein EssB [Clostridium felsineum]URZ09493.1 Type VII secretion system protein EssB [Clostridium felsineum]
MKISNNNTSLEFERNKDFFQVRLESTQFKEAVLKELSDKVMVNEDNETWVLSYHVPEAAKSLASVTRVAKTRLERLKLAQKLVTLSGLENQFKIPFLHPENILLMGETLFVVHFGLHKLLVPFDMTQVNFLKSYKALIFYIFNSKVPFEALVSGASAMNDKFSQKINSFESIEEIVEFIDHELQKETEKINRNIAFVSKKRYSFFKYFGTLAIILALVLGWFTYSYYSNNQKQNAIITAHTDFLTNNYDKTQTDLQNYSPSKLPKSARYILAVSSVNLSDLTMAQKQAVLNNISTKSDDNTLNYWVYSGRGDFKQALNLAQNLGDVQLTLLAYTNLYETTKLNTTMDGAKKQQLLDEYNKKIQELTKNLGK